MPKRKRGNNLQDRKHAVTKRAQRVTAARLSLCPSAIEKFPARHKIPRLTAIAAKGNVWYLSELKRCANEAGNVQWRVISEAFVVLDENNKIVLYYDPHAISQEGRGEFVANCEMLWDKGKCCVYKGLTNAPPKQKMRLSGHTCSLNWFCKLPCRVVHDKEDGMQECGERIAVKISEDMLGIVGPATYLLPEVPFDAMPFCIKGGRGTTLAMTKNYESYRHDDRDGGGSAVICWVTSGVGKRPAGGNFVLPDLGLEFKTYHGAAIMFDTSEHKHYTQLPVPVKGGSDLIGMSLYQNAAVLRNAKAIGATRVLVLEKAVEIIKGWVIDDRLEKRN